jgi:hypothetical protein
MAGSGKYQGISKTAFLGGAFVAVSMAGMAIAAGQTFTPTQGTPAGLITPTPPPRASTPPLPTLSAAQQAAITSQQPTVPAALVAQIKAATTPAQVNDLIAAASVTMTPAQIGQLVSAAVAAHNSFAASIVSAATAAHPNAVNQIAVAAIAALPEGQRMLASQSILNAAATAAKISIVQVTAALHEAYPTLAISQSVGFGYVPTVPTPPVVAALHPSIAYSFASTLLSPLSSSSPAGASTPNTGIGAITVEPPATDPSKGGSGSPT